jgi:hypothetical protein
MGFSVHLYAAYQPQLDDSFASEPHTETNDGGCRLLVAVLSRYKGAFALCSVLLIAD